MEEIKEKLDLIDAKMKQAKLMRGMYGNIVEEIRTSHKELVEILGNDVNEFVLDKEHYQMIGIRDEFDVSFPGLKIFTVKQSNHFKIL